jgi:hypothetical protein
MLSAAFSSFRRRIARRHALFGENGAEGPVFDKGRVTTRRFERLRAALTRARLAISTRTMVAEGDIVRDELASALVSAVSRRESHQPTTVRTVFDLHF